MKVLKLVLSTALIVSSMAAVADCSPNGCADVSIERLHVEASGSILIGTSGDEKKLTCKAVSDLYLTLEAGAAGKSEIYSTLLAAQLSNKIVSNISVDSSLPGCVVKFVTLDKQ
jgi:hypothetical protein